MFPCAAKQCSADSGDMCSKSKTFNAFPQISAHWQIMTAGSNYTGLLGQLKSMETSIENKKKTKKKTGILDILKSHTHKKMPTHIITSYWPQKIRIKKKKKDSHNLYQNKKTTKETKASTEG